MAMPLSNCYLPLEKPESEMTIDELKLMHEFRTMQIAARLCDHIHWDTQLLKAQCNAMEYFINKK